MLLALLSPGLVLQVRRRGSKLALGVVDQGVVSGANFALNLLLARWLSPGDFGTFAVAFSLFLFFAGFHNAMLLEPMSVLGPIHFRDELPGYFGVLVRIHALLSPVLIVGTAFLGWFLLLLGFNLVPVLLVMAATAPFILLYWLLRGACYVATDQGLALLGGLGYACVLLGGVVVLRSLGAVSPSSGFWLMGAASIVASLILLRPLVMRTGGLSRRRAWLEMGAVLGQHWKYGKWVVGSAFVHWFGDIYTVLIGGLVGLPQAGALRAFQNIMAPLHQTLSGLGLVLQPWLSGQKASRGDRAVGLAVNKVVLGNSVLAIGYGVLLLLQADRVTRLLYPEGQYSSYQWLLPYLGGVAVAGAAANGLAMGLKALKRPDAVFWAQTLKAVMAATFGVFLVWSYGLVGAALGMLAGAVLLVISLVWFLRVPRGG